MGACASRAVEWTGEDYSAALLNQTVSHLSEEIPLQEALDETARFVTSILKCDSCTIYVLEKYQLFLRAATNPSPKVIRHLKFNKVQELIGWSAENYSMMVIEERACEDSRAQLFSDNPADRFESLLLLPLMSGGQLVGVISVRNRAKKQYSVRDIHMVTTIGFLVGNAIERERLENENSRLVEKLETRNIVEQAKKILQDELKISEEDAYRTIQRQSQERNKSMKEIAAAVIFSSELKKSSSRLAYEGSEN